MRNDLARAQAELVNFRKRVERDRAANRDAVIAEVIRTMLPAVDDLDRAEAHGDLAGSSLELVAQKLHAAFARYGLRTVGEKGEAFDPNFHEAVVQLPSRRRHREHGCRRDRARLRARRPAAARGQGRRLCARRPVGGLGGKPGLVR